MKALLPLASEYFVRQQEDRATAREFSEVCQGCETVGWFFRGLGGGRESAVEGLEVGHRGGCGSGSLFLWGRQRL